MRRLTGLLKAAPRNPVQAIEAEIAGLETTKASLLERIPALEASKAEALTRRRESLIAGASAEGEADAHRAAREADDNLAAVADALAEIERRLAEARERLDAAQTSQAREAASAALEEDAIAIEAAAENTRRAVAALARARDELATAITPRAAPLFAKYHLGDRRDHDSPTIIANFLVGHAIATDFDGLDAAESPRLHGSYWTDARPIKVDRESPAAPVEAYLTTPMRQQAAKVRSGAASPELPAWVEPEPDFTPAVHQALVYVTVPFSYVPQTGHMPDQVNVNRTSLPAPVAERAIKRGWASDTEPRGWEHMLERESHAHRGRSYADVASLDFDLSEWKQGEIDRARSTWLAERGRAAA